MPLLPEIPSPVEPSAPLEWDKFVAFVGGYAQSALGRAWIGALDAVDGARVGGTASKPWWRRCDCWWRPG
jgi:hypothetical protein